MPKPPSLETTEVVASPAKGSAGNRRLLTEPRRLDTRPGIACDRACVSHECASGDAT